jgi:hypothetical protein
MYDFDFQKRSKSLHSFKKLWSAVVEVIVKACWDLATLLSPHPSCVLMYAADERRKSS